VDVSVPHGSIGTVLDLPAPISFELAPALAGEVAIFSLSLTNQVGDSCQTRH
jgi:hypothetical protein